jgi:hypothetical protein
LYLKHLAVLLHPHLAKPKEDEKIRFRDVQAQPRKIISSPTWSGLEDEHVSYNAGYTNVHEYIPWRTLTFSSVTSSSVFHAIPLPPLPILLIKGPKEVNFLEQDWQWRQRYCMEY